MIRFSLTRQLWPMKTKQNRSSCIFSYCMCNYYAILDVWFFEHIFSGVVFVDPDAIEKKLHCSCLSVLPSSDLESEAGGPVRQPYVIVDTISQSGAKNLASWCWGRGIICIQSVCVAQFQFCQHLLVKSLSHAKRQNITYFFYLHLSETTYSTTPTYCSFYDFRT